MEGVGLEGDDMGVDDWEGGGLEGVGLEGEDMGVGDMEGDRVSDGGDANGGKECVVARKLFNSLC